MDSKERFSNRVDWYVKYRPGYPKAAIDYLYDVVGLRPDSRVADIGAGTGIFSGLLLERGSRVMAVEPNEAMRAVAEQRLNGHPKFRAVPGSAESTGLTDGSVEFIVCAQSFHWFDRAKAKTEFRRVLRPGGKVILIWNSRLVDGTPFREAYEQLIQTYGTDYRAINHRNISRTGLLAFFKDGTMQEARFAMSQTFDFEGLKGRLLSSSYIPLPGHPRHDAMMEALRNLFDRHNRQGRVSIDYETVIVWGEV
jgi:SAM-dependent methyltransferase